MLKFYWQWLKEEINMYQYIVKYYKMGLYKDQQLDVFVSAGMMTADQKEELITAKS